MKHCSNCKHCGLDVRAIMICGVCIHKCHKKGHHIIHPFFSGFRCGEYLKNVTDINVGNKRGDEHGSKE